MYKHASRLPRNHSAGHMNSTMTYGEYNRRRQRAQAPEPATFGASGTKVVKRNEMRGVARDTGNLTYKPFASLRGTK